MEGAERFYTLENNPTRSETIEEARALDIKTLNAWIGHPNVKIIDNSTDFTGKIKRTVEAICTVVGKSLQTKKKKKMLLINALSSNTLCTGAPIPSHHERKFLLSEFPALDQLPMHFEVFKLEEV